MTVLLTSKCIAHKLLTNSTFTVKKFKFEVSSKDLTFKTKELAQAKDKKIVLKNS